ncbi:FecR domain-containing protein [Larkinella harenae]
MEQNQAEKLIQKYKAGTLTPEERALLESWYHSVARTKALEALPDDLEDRLDAIWDALPVHQTAPEKRLPTTRPFRIGWVAAAATVLMVCSLALYWFYKPEVRQPIAHVNPISRDIAPGDNRALLTLADGSTIVLNDARTGELARQGDATIRKPQEGQIVFAPQLSSVPSSRTAPTRYNVLSTPRAGQYQIKLPDGTTVWLNAVSTLRFPTAFSSTERRVEVTGEAYFAVTPQLRNGKKIPFRVVAGRQTIEVLGTEFNINSYPDEAFVRTTLLEGSVQVRVADNAASDVVLRPGQQARLAHPSQPASSSSLVVQEVDTEGVISWKNGYFRFEQANLPELMRQIARWYDVEVEFEGTPREREFVGQIERRANLSKVLKILELGGVRFRVEGKKIIVTE